MAARRPHTRRQPARGVDADRVVEARREGFHERAERTGWFDAPFVDSGQLRQAPAECQGLVSLERLQSACEPGDLAIPGGEEQQDSRVAGTEPELASRWAWDRRRLGGADTRDVGVGEVRVNLWMAGQEV